MRKTVPIVLLLALAAFLWALPTLTAGDRAVTGGRAVKAYNQENLVRFHVVANSDGDADQSAKLRVRDAIIKATAPVLRNLAGKEEVMAYLEEHRRLIQDVASQELARAGSPYPVEVEVGRFSFDARTFRRWELPGGDYDAVRVIIGEGKGRNWWCILFPPVCFVEPDEDIPVNEPEVRFPGHQSSSQVEVRFALVELARGIRQRLAQALDDLAMAGRNGF